MLPRVVDGSDKNWSTLLADRVTWMRVSFQSRDINVLNAIDVFAYLYTRYRSKYQSLHVCEILMITY